METNNYNEANRKQHKIMFMFGITEVSKVYRNQAWKQTTQNNVRFWHHMCQRV